ncbi:MAG TPA: hypothetical protein VIV11_09985 [Kofleriaceae bacterium]
MGRALAIAVLLLSTSTALADEPPPLRVAVVPGIAVNLDTARVDALSQDLAQALMSELVVEATGGLEVRRLLPPDGLPPDCVTTPACTADVAKRTNAQQLLFVVMVDSGSGGSIQVDTTWVDPVTGKSASRSAIDLQTAADATAKFTLAAPELLPDAPRRPKQTNGGGGLGVNTKMSDSVPRHFTSPAKITAAVGVVGLGAGIAFGLTTRSRYRECGKNNAINCSEGDRDAIRNFGLLADAGWLLALGGAIVTTALYWTSAEEPRLIVAPGPDGATVSAIGRF